MTLVALAQIRKEVQRHTVFLLSCATFIAAMCIATLANAAAGNIIANPSAESSINGQPEYWQPSSWGANSASFNYTNSGYNSSKALSVTISSLTSGDAKWIHASVPVTAGQRYVFSDAYISTVATEYDVFFYDAAGNMTVQYLGEVPASNAWKQSSYTFTAPVNAVRATVAHVIYTPGTLTTDAYSLSELTTTPPPTTGNLIPNPSFESSATGTVPDGWSQGGWGTNSRSYAYDTDAHSGGKSARVDISSYASGDAKWFSAPISVKPGTLYRYSDYFKSNAQTQVIAAFSSSSSITIQYVNLGTLPASATWKQFSGTLSVPSNSNQVTIYHVLSSTGSLSLDDVSLTETATPPTDVQPGEYIANGSVESGDISPSGWNTASWGNNQSQFEYVSTSASNGSKSLKVVVGSYVDGDAKWYFEPTTKLVPGKEYRITFDYRGSVAPAVVAMFTDANGINTYQGLASPNGVQATSWSTYTSTLKVPTNTAKTTIFALINKNGWVQTDNYSLVDYVVTGFNRGIVTVMFDDVDARNAQTALPLLNQYGIKSTNCFISDVIKNDTQSISAVKQFYKDGHEICSHTVTHSDLTTVSASSLDTELRDSKLYLESVLNTPSTTTSGGKVVQSSTVPLKVACPAWEDPTFGGGGFVYVNKPANTYCASGFTEVDYGINDPNSAQLAKIVNTLKTQWPSGVTKVHIRYNHEINGNWYPWSSKTPEQFKRDFANMKSTIIAGVGPTIAKKIDFVLGLNGGTHPHPVTGVTYSPDAWYTPDADSISVSFYDMRYPETAPSYAEDWNSYNTTPYNGGNPIGPEWWLAWSKSKGKKFNFGEWGSKEGIYMARMNDFIRKNYMDMDYHAYLANPTSPDFNHRWALYNPYVSYQETTTTLPAVAQNAKIETFAYPYGSYNNTVVDAAKKYYLSARVTDTGYNSKDNFDIYRLKTQNVYNTTTAAEVRTWVDQAIKDKTWLILTYHQVKSSPGLYDTDAAMLSQHLSTMKQSGATILTQQAALREITPQLP